MVRAGRGLGASAGLRSCQRAALADRVRPRAVESRVVRVNLLERRQPVAPAARAARVLPALALVLALAAAAAHAAAASSAERAARIAQLRAVAQARAAPVERLRAQVTQLERAASEAEHLRATGPRLAAQLARLADALPRAAWLTALEVESDGALRISGRAPQFATVGAVLAALERVHAFGAPHLLDAQRPSDTSAALRFQMETRAP
ncbi:hypothetical protein EPN52_14760 [bacterium]|nr:MAG: hypothetical protein EPN52_14760 [bacterium]